MTVDNLSRVVRGIASLAAQRVLVGIPSTEAPRTNDEINNPMNNATIGYIMENGSPVNNVPARPFLVPGVRDARLAIVRRLADASRAALDGSDRRVDQNLNAAGLTAQASVRNKITDGPFLPLAPRTLAQRRARGRTGERPLIDTGQLRNSINYVIRRGA